MCQGILFRYFLLLGANACVELNRFEEAITWCDKGLAVSFITSCRTVTASKECLYMISFCFCIDTKHLFMKKSFHNKRELLLVFLAIIIFAYSLTKREEAIQMEERAL